MKIKYLLYIFIPAIIVAGLALTIRIVQYAPLRPSEKQIQEKLAQIKSLPVLADDPYIGSKKAPVTVIAFEDPGCEGCSNSFDLVRTLLAKYPEKIRIVFKMIPVTKFPYPTDKAIQYLYCANEQKKFETLAELTFTNYNILTDKMLDTLVEKAEIDLTKLETCMKSGRAAQFLARNVELGMMLNIQSVPTFFYNNKQIKTPQLIEEWEAVLGL
ncbi:MAG TPA: thioredoxin domain-containing protein [Candidatus Magasanikbacteria bacterium]|nr:thioredoxin domain-containing protein [Candidatus Magasanikbacteria bacterium]